MDFAGGAAPTGWLICDGSAVSRTTYSALYGVFGGAASPWGQGDGSTTFNLPDLRSRLSVGAGQGSGLTNRVLAATGGEELHALALGELAAHTHNIAAGQFNHNHADSGHMHGAGYSPVATTAGPGTAVYAANGTTAQNTAINYAAIGYNTLPAGVTASVGSGTGHNNMPPFVVLNKIVKT
jgi:microcystin-dependent protein